MRKKSVQFKRGSWHLAADIYFPPDFEKNNFDQSKKYPALIVAHPIGGCKEQTSGLYAAEMAEHGYVTLAFDASTQGASEGLKRHREDPNLRMEDFRCTVDYLVTLPYVDEERIGLVGICGAGGYAANVTMTERRVKALATIAAVNYGRLLRETAGNDAETVKALEGLCALRTKQAHGAEPEYGHIIPDSMAELQEKHITDMDITEATEYYRTPRAQSSYAPNKVMLTSLISAYSFDAFHLTEYLLTQPLLVIAGSKAGSLGSYRDAYELYNRTASKEKSLYVIDGASHVDLYDRPEAVNKAVTAMSDFFGKYL